jgi:hypothetical protein
MDDELDGEDFNDEEIPEQEEEEEMLYGDEDFIDVDEHDLNADDIIRSIIT